MKKCLFFLAVSTSFFQFISCDKETDYFSSINKNPSFEISRIKENTFINYVKDSFKIRNHTYSFLFNYTDDQENFSIKCDTQFNVFIDYKNNKISYVPEQTGNKQIQLIASDPYGNKAECKLELDVFDNLKPVAIFTYSVDQLSSKVTIDGNGSYDPDKQYGGDILTYEFKYGNGNPILRSLPIYEQNYIKGVIVSLRVMDNDSAWSDYFYKVIN